MVIETVDYISRKQLVRMLEKIAQDMFGKVSMLEKYYFSKHPIKI